MLKKVIRIILCLLSGIASVTILYWTSGTQNTHKNGFDRNINPQFLRPFHSLDIDISSTLVLGRTKNNIFLSKTYDPLHIYVVNASLTKVESKSWNFPINAELSELHVAVDSPILNIYDRGSNLITTFLINNENARLKSRDSVHGRQFDIGDRISWNSFILRTLNKNLNQYTLSKLMQSEGSLIENKTAITKQFDGFLCSDGMLFYDSSLSRIVYLYYYRNQFLILDSNLTLIHKANTIDTVTRAQIKIHHFQKEKYVTFEAPAVITNRKACVWKGRLYIQSSLLSDNEDRKMFSNNSIVDVYDLKNDHYLYSFYIPHHNQYKVDGFQVYDTLLIAIQGNFIVSYIINAR